MNLKCVLSFCAFVLFTISAHAGELQPALYADPTYPTKDIKQITVVGYDARDDKTLEVNLDLVVDQVNSNLDKRGYKIKGFKTGFAAGLANLKSSVKRVAHGKDTTMTPEDSLVATLSLANLTTDYEIWLSNISETVGNWIFVVVVNAAEATKHGVNYDCHAILTGYLFDRAQHKLIWSDRADMTDLRAGTDYQRYNAHEDKLMVYVQFTEVEATHGMLHEMINKKLSQSIAKRGKNFKLPEQHE